MNLTISKGDFKSEDTGELLHCQNEYSKSLSWAKNLNFPPQNSKQLIQILGGKFKFSAQDSDLEYLFWQCKNSPVSSDLKPPLVGIVKNIFISDGVPRREPKWL